MPQFAIGDSVTYQGYAMIIHFISGEQITCVYRATDHKFHSIVLNAQLLSILPR